VRELSCASDSAAQLGKLASELDHARAKEGLTRAALNRSEQERWELERQARGLKQQLSGVLVQLGIAQDQARWAWSVVARLGWVGVAAACACVRACAHTHTHITPLCDMHMCTPTTWPTQVGRV
jgi:hypothetical protein